MSPDSAMIQGHLPRSNILIAEARNSVFRPVRTYCTGQVSDVSAAGAHACRTTNNRPRPGLCLWDPHSLCLWATVAVDLIYTVVREGHHSMQCHPQPEESAHEEDSPLADQHEEGDRQQRARSTRSRKSRLASSWLAGEGRLRRLVSVMGSGCVVAHAKMVDLARGEDTAGAQFPWNSYGLQEGKRRTSVSSADASRMDEGQALHLREADTWKIPCAHALRVSPIQEHVTRRTCLAHTRAELVVPSHAQYGGPSHLDSFYHHHAILYRTGARRAADGAQCPQDKGHSMVAMHADANMARGHLKKVAAAMACDMKHRTAGRVGRRPLHRVCGRHQTYQAQADTADACRGLSVADH